MRGPPSGLAGAAFAFLAVASAAPAFADADPARGERVFQRCFACHSVDPDEKAALQGPSLYRILGRPAGVIEGFDYSEAMKVMGEAGMVWDEATIDAYLQETATIVPGTRMQLTPPLRDEQDRADLIAFLAATGRHEK